MFCLIVLKLLPLICCLDIGFGPVATVGTSPPPPCVFMNLENVMCWTSYCWLADVSWTIDLTRPHFQCWNQIDSRFGYWQNFWNIWVAASLPHDAMMLCSVNMDIAWVTSVGRSVFSQRLPPSSFFSRTFVKFVRYCSFEAEMGYELYFSFLTRTAVRMS